MRKNFYSFYGRIGRLEYIGRSIAMVTFAIVAYILGSFVLNYTIGNIYIGILSILLLASLLSLLVRRLHDVNLSGWLILLLFLPIFISIPNAIMDYQKTGSLTYILQMMNPYARFWPRERHFYSLEDFFWFLPWLGLFLITVWAGTFGPNRYGKR